MDGWLTIGTKLDTKSFTAQIDELQDKIDDIEATLNMDNSNGLLSDRDIKELNKELEKAKNKMSDLKKKQLELENPSLGGGFANSLKDLKNLVKQAGKYALAIFGIRSAYSAVRNAMSTLSQYNEQLSADLEYIRYALAKTLEPLILSIVNLVYTLLGYLNQISMAWFGINLFANSSYKGMKKAGAEAEKMRKSLAGFDEINVLSSSGSSSSGSAGGVAPSMDLSSMQQETPAWLQFIKDNRDIILGFLAGVITAISLIGKELTFIQNLGIVVLVTGIVMLISDLIELINNPTWEGFTNVLADIAIAIGGVMLITGNWWGLLVAIIGLLVKLVVDNWDVIQNILNNAIKWLDEKSKWLEDKGFYVTAYILQLVKGLVQMVKDLFQGLFIGIKQIFDGIVQIANGDIGGGLVNIFKGAANIIIGILNSLISGVNAIAWPIRKLIVGIGSVLGKSWSIDTIQIPKIPTLAVGGIVDIPKTGMLLGNAIVGEAGAEGVLPLTNPQTMAQLGQEIGKWITLNINMTNELDGRILSKRLQTINNNNNFAMNR